MAEIPFISQFFFTALISAALLSRNNEQRSISDVLRKDLNFTFKKLKVVPQESLNKQNQVKSIEYAMLMSQVDP
jgi:hypothetical protein